MSDSEKEGGSLSPDVLKILKDEAGRAKQKVVIDSGIEEGIPVTPAEADRIVDEMPENQ